MSGSLVGGIIGAVIGFTMGNPALGWMIGSTLGGLVAPPDGPKPPGLSDLRPQSSEYGRPIPIIYGTMAVSGNVIWASDIVQTSEGSSGGGDIFGGFEEPTPPTYACNVAILLCESNGDRQLGRIWAGPEKRLVYDGVTLESGTLRYYDGNEEQLPDPLIESYLGTGQVPAYRGYAYVVLEGFDITANDGNRIPIFWVEVGAVPDTDELGSVWIFQTLKMDNDQWAVFFHGSHDGFVVRQFEDYGFMHERLYPVQEWVPFSDRFSYEATTGVFVVGTGGAGSLRYDTYSVATGFHGTHTITTPTEHDPNPGSNAYATAAFDGEIIMIGPRATSGGVTVWVIDPGTHTCTDCYTGSLPTGYTLIANFILPGPAGSGYVVAAVRDTAGAKYLAKLSVASGVAVDIVGELPPNCGLSGDVQINSDENEIWSVSTSSGTLYVRAFNLTTHEVRVDDAVSAANFSLSPNGRTPISFGPDTVVITGGWGDGTIQGSNFDGFAWYTLVDGEWERGYGPQSSGCSYGLQYLQGQLWNAVENEWFGLRRFGTVTPGPEPHLTGIANYEDGVSACVPNEAAFNIADADTTPQPMTLADIVADLSLRAGLTEEQFDVTALTDLVDGYFLANQVSVKDAITTLMPAYYFDAVEDQGVLRFVKRGGDIAEEIPDDDLGVHDSASEDVLDLLETTRGMDDELPHTLSVNYVLAATKYSPATKYARRLIGYSGDEARMDMPFVFSDQKAMEIAHANLHEQWVGRIKFKLSLGRKYSHLMPTDLVGVQVHTMRLVREVKRDNGVIEFEAVRDDSQVYTPIVIVDETPPPDESVNVPVLTVLELM